MTRKRRAHLAGALLWTLLAVPALLWWREAVWFVIVASLWANVYGPLAAAESADDRRVLDKLDRLAELLDPNPGGLMTPTIGRIVLYRLTEQDADAINSRRDDARAHSRIVGGMAGAIGDPGQPGRTGHVAHVGNGVRAGEQYPAVIVRVWPAPPSGAPGVVGLQSVNLQVMLDGTDTLWTTSVTEGDNPRQYAWPPRV